MIRIERNKRVAQFTTFGVGGSAHYFCEVHSTLEIKDALQWAIARKIQWRLIAGGSNIVFRDGIIPGLLIRIAGGKIVSKGENLLYVEAGVPLARLISYSIQKGLSGLESLSGIPGTVGGALVGNAGAYGHSIEESVARVRILDGGTERWITKEECGFGYRESVFKHNGWIVLGVEFVFKKGDKVVLVAQSKKIIAERLKKYPAGLKCPGSYFKNIPVATLPRIAIKKIDESKIIAGKVPAGYLLESVGAKGMKRGGIRVATYHGNLIYNNGKGTARDAKTLARQLNARVKKQFGITLEEEVRYI